LRDGENRQDLVCVGLVWPDLDDDQVKWPHTSVSLIVPPSDNGLGWAGPGLRVTNLII
jgi:hypothetical protein